MVNDYKVIQIKDSCCLDSKKERRREIRKYRNRQNLKRRMYRYAKRRAANYFKRKAVHLIRRGLPSPVVHSAPKVWKRNVPTGSPSWMKWALTKAGPAILAGATYGLWRRTRGNRPALPIFNTPGSWGTPPRHGPGRWIRNFPSGGNSPQAFTVARELFKAALEGSPKGEIPDEIMYGPKNDL